MRKTDAKLKSATNNRLGRECLLGEHHRVTRIGRNDRSPNFDIWNVLCRYCDRSECIHAENLRHPETREALFSCFSKAVLKRFYGWVKSEYCDVHVLNLANRLTLLPDGAKPLDRLLQIKHPGASCLVS